MPAPRNALAKRGNDFRMQTAEPHEATWRDTLARMITGDEGLTLESERLAQGLTGSSGLGQRALALSDLVPGLGVVTQGVDASEHLARGNLPAAAWDVGSMLIPVGAGKLISKFANKLGKDGAELTSAIHPQSSAATKAPKDDIKSIAFGTYDQPQKVEEIAEPLRAYHATQADFDTFDTRYSGDGFVHFGTGEQASKVAKLREQPLDGGPVKSGARILPVNIYARRSLRMPDMISWRPTNMADYISAKISLPGADRLSEMVRSLPTEELQRRAIRDWLRKSNIDVIKYNNMFEGAGDSYLVANPGSVRSALTNELLYGAGGAALAGRAAYSRPED